MGAFGPSDHGNPETLELNPSCCRVKSPALAFAAIGGHMAREYPFTALEVNRSKYLEKSRLPSHQKPDDSDLSSDCYNKIITASS